MNLKLCEIVQQCEYLSQEQIEKGLSNDRIRNYAYIYHTQDVKEDGSPVSPHVHIALRLKDTCNTKHIAQWFGVQEQYVCRVKGRWSDMLKYLTHENAPGKHKYKEDEVISNFDWVKVKEKFDNKALLEEIISKIEKGEIREYNQYQEIPIELWARNRTLIKNSLDYYREMKFMDKNREITVIFCTGATGTGKTTFAKEYAKMTNRSICISSCSNDVMQDYKGEDILVLDDLRDENFKFTDVLKMLDNHTKSTMFSRYFNKGFLGDTIIITSYKDVVNWYKDIPEESRIQLFRRVGIRYVFTQDYITSYHWDTNNYVCDGRMKNIYKIKAKEKVLTGLDILKSMGYEKEGIKLEEIKEKVNNMSNEQVEKIWVDDDLEEINEEENQEIQGIFKN